MIKILLALSLSLATVMFAPNVTLPVLFFYIVMVFLLQMSDMNMTSRFFKSYALPALLFTVITVICWFFAKPLMENSHFIILTYSFLLLFTIQKEGWASKKQSTQPYVLAFVSIAILVFIPERYLIVSVAIFLLAFFVFVYRYYPASPSSRILSVCLLIGCVFSLSFYFAYSSMIVDQLSLLASKGPSDMKECLQSNLSICDSAQTLISGELYIRELDARLLTHFTLSFTAQVFLTFLFFGFLEARHSRQKQMEFCWNC